jgi:hypothetical protein
MRRIITGVFSGTIDRDAPTIPPPSAPSDSVGSGLHMVAQPASFRGFAPVSPTPRRLHLKARKR